MKMAEMFLKGQETHWEKEKLLVMSHFSFSHSVFKRHTCKNQGFFVKWLSKNKRFKMHLSFEKDLIVLKESKRSGGLVFNASA